MNFTFEDENGFDEVVAIDQINGESINSNIEGDVFNMAGQRVGTSIEGLSKGLYIRNGKKILVKRLLGGKSYKKQSRYAYRQQDF